MFTKMLFLFYVLCFIQSSAASRSYSVFDCKENWNVTYEDNHQMTVNFQNWLYAWQNQCLASNVTKPAREYMTDPAPSNGIGYSYNVAIKSMIIGIEQGLIFRPEVQYLKRFVPSIWLWADEDPKKCTLGMRTFDCFSQPISTCGRSKSLDQSSAKGHVDLINKFVNHFDALAITDTCSFARASNKPLQWILGQYTQYFFRGYKENIQVAVNDRMRLVFGASHTATTQHHYDHNVAPKLVNRKDGVSIGVQVRGGDPDDLRHISGVADYVKLIDSMAANLAAAGTPVCFVYLCSHDQENNIVSSEHMSKEYPNRPFKWIVIPHTSLGAGETELLLRNESIPKPPDIRETLVMEFYADLEIMTSVDYYIGSIGSIYPHIAALRIARGIHKANNHTCLLDNLNSKEGILQCEGSEFVKNRMWRHYYGGFKNRNQGMDFVDMN